MNKLKQFIKKTIKRLLPQFPQFPVNKIDQLETSLKNSHIETIKNQILCRWQVTDAMDKLRFPDDYEVKCGICGYTNKKHTFEIKVSHCIFNGGRLERFVCPECGVIFGPLKTLSMDEPQLAEEYKICLSVFPGDDSNAQEVATFHSIVNDKNGIYLNFGSGAWSNGSKTLRDSGYNVYDYDPYAPAEKSEWLITDKAQLREMKFDGIFSNDLLEHLPDPIESLIFMKSLLKDKKSKMAHSTPCYEYLYEYTRFHFYFFKGDSVRRICDKAGLDYAMPPINPDKSHYMNCIYTNKQ